MKAASKTSWDRKMKEKAEKQSFVEFKKEALTTAKEKRKVR